MSTTIPFEFNGAEYITEVVSSRDIATEQAEYFIKINGDPACFVNFRHSENAMLMEESSSDDLTADFKQALKTTLNNYLLNKI